MGNSPFKDPRGIAGNIIAHQAYTHAISVLFGFVEDPNADAIPTNHIASAALILFGDVICAVTAYHVLNNYWKLKEQDPRYKFQVGSFVCEPAERLRDSDEGLDLAILDMSNVPLERLNNRDDGDIQPLKPSRWPNDPVKPDDFVVLCGFPIGTREIDVKKRRIGSIAYAVIEHVLSVDDNYFIVSFNKDEWVTIPTDVAAPDAIKAADVNGLSGSPVFSGMRDIAGSIEIMEFVGTVLSEVPFGVSGVRVRSSRCLTADGFIARAS